MAQLHELNFTDFQQPAPHAYSRKMQGAEEIIQYLPNSHIKIWYNTDPNSFENHFHNCVEIIFLFEGECSAGFQTTNFNMTTGDILIIPPYIMHNIKAVHQFRQFVMQLDVSPLVSFGIYSNNTSTVNDILLCNTQNCPQIYDTIYNNIIDMINSYFAYESFWELETYSHFLQVISTIGKSKEMTNAVNLPGAALNTKEHYDKFAELLRYLETNYSEQLSLDSVSSQVGFSKYHFVRLFKDYTGSTFYDYLTDKRIQHAKELLSTNAGITDIAFSCGFNNQTSFCRTFKKVCGCPPTEYRRTIMMSQSNK